MNPKSIFEDKQLLVFDKPSGWVVNRVESAKGQGILQDFVRDNYNFPLAEDEKHRNGIVHRLDKETSGVMLVAKTVESFENLQKQFKDRKVEKTYIALVHGRVGESEGRIDVPTGRLPWSRKKFGPLPGGRETVTNYKVTRYYKKGDQIFTLLEVYPKTGRTHQIRIHMKYLGHAVVSDEFYAGRKTARADREWCPRLFLHALSIKISHPKSGGIVLYRSELPQDLALSLEKLTNRP